MLKSLISLRNISIILVSCLFISALNTYSATTASTENKQAKAETAATIRKINLFDLSDSLRVLRNPHKGWYHHFFDNADWRYHGQEEDIMAFPGLDLLFIRLSWQHFEPQEGAYDWHWIDSVKNIYVPKGLKIGLAITAKETRETYATPQWVSKAGAKGTLIPYINEHITELWEPEYNDPIFLQKLDNFHKACAARYDGEKWLSFVQMASYGSWGEGHNWPVSAKNWPDSVKIKHIQIHKKHYLKTPICISDDAYNNAFDKPQFKNFVESNGLFWTDHSILVTSYVNDYPNTFSLSTPALFDATWKSRPTQLELEHYHKVKAAIVKDAQGKDIGLWSVPEGTSKGAALVRGSLELSHASWLGFHGDIKLWHSENPNLAKELANKIGYWYFVSSLELPDTLKAGQATSLAVTWENRGVAPAYFGYKVKLKLQSGNEARVIDLGESGNREWMPKTPSTRQYAFTLPSMPAGNYALKIKLVEENPETTLLPAAAQTPVHLALKESLQDTEGFYQLTTVAIQSGPMGIKGGHAPHANRRGLFHEKIYFDDKIRSLAVNLESDVDVSGLDAVQWSLFKLNGKPVLTSPLLHPTLNSNDPPLRWAIHEVPAGFYIAGLRMGGKSLLQIVQIR